MEIPHPPTPSKPKMLGTALLAAVAIALGIWLSTLLVPRPAVGLIRLEADIWSGSAFLVKKQIEAARQDPAIQAVVLIIDSPGGEVAPTQDIYLELLSLRQDMPVVGSINGLAASGGYYLAVATDPLYAKPNSTIGNVGVWGFVPENIGVNEVVLASGPFKLSGDNEEEFLRRIEGIKQEFLQTVAVGRGERLEISLTELGQGLAYSGRQALEFGMIDALASQAEAVKEAARQAKISGYRVIDLQDRVLEELLAEEAPVGYLPGETAPVQYAPPAEDAQPPAAANPNRDAPPALWFLSPWLGAADPLTGQRTLPPGIYLLYDVRIGGDQ